MSRTEQEREDGMIRSPDRALWQRCRMTDVPEDEAERFLDLAAFAEGRLETDEHDRVAAALANDPAAAADVAAAAAQALAGGIDETPEGLDRAITRALGILPSIPAAPGRVVPLPPPRQDRRILHVLTRWGSLAAAIAFASWLGFDMGSDTSLALGQTGTDVSLLPELLDPGTGFLRDLGEGLRR
jgi:anti-sigma factor RsiW